MVQTCKRTQRGTSKSSILVGEDAPNGAIPNLEASATNELSNHDHEIEEILAIALDIIFLEAPPSSNCKEGVEWVKKDLKWLCKIKECKESYVAKWILIAHTKRVHDLIIEKGNLGCRSTHKRGPRHQNHLVMNARILSDAQLILQRNEQNAIVCA
jgi:hypothetical protein